MLKNILLWRGQHSIQQRYVFLVNTAVGSVALTVVLGNTQEEHFIQEM